MWPAAPGPITTWPTGEHFDARLDAVLFEPAGRATVRVIGESEFQGLLELIGGERTADGVRDSDHVAMLLPEPDNPDDAEAMRVVIVPRPSGSAWGKVGYLSPDDAAAFRPVVDRVASLGKVTCCRASLEADAAGPIGIMLALASPPLLMLELDDDYGTDPRWPTSEILGADRPYSRHDCPYCGVALDPLPSARARCPSCRAVIYVRPAPDGIRYLLREADLEAHEARWGEHSEPQE